MRTINQFSLVRSQEEALVPKGTLIDGRTEQDRLSFLVDFASLINFFDSNNQHYFNWEPVLLKDPTFLLASIAKTKFARQQREMMNFISDNSASENDFGKSIDRLCFQLLEGFMLLGKWTHYMQQSNKSYNLKKYVLREVRTHFSAELWALLALRQQLFSSSKIQANEPIKNSLFKSYDEKIWKQSNGKRPYWEVLNIAYPLPSNSDKALLDAIVNMGNRLYTFMDQIIASATQEFAQLKTQKSEFPDTILLRTFVNLLKVQQDQLNTLSEKHLQFYYNSILKQEKNAAVADTVFICATLAKKDAILKLPTGTLFNAGVDSAKNPILFESIRSVYLNPAKISGAYTLLHKKHSFLLQKIPTPSVLGKDEKGQIKKWDTFGGDSLLRPPKQKLGFAIASPMLLLREGARYITLQLKFTAPIDLKLLKDVQYFLSTKQNWFQVSKVEQKPKVSKTKKTNEVSLVIYLKESDPPIEAFLKNPDGLDSPWPQLKMLSSTFYGGSTPIVLQELTINITASNLKTFKLYNDSGTLSPKNPFALFGLSPQVNSNFIIGSTEIFSKPLQFFNIQLNWSQLPKNFQAYYQAYNNYLNHQYDGGAGPKSTLKKIIDFIKRLVISPKPKKDAKGPFNNLYFTVRFKQLQNASWKSLEMTKMLSCDALLQKIVGIPYTINPKFLPKGFDVNNLLFSPNRANLDLVQPNTSFFACTDGKCSLVPDPKIQYTSLKYTDKSTSGFIKMSLSNTEEGLPENSSLGFGKKIYPKVVSAVTLMNAIGIAKSYKKPPPKLILPPSLPFTPKVKLFSANYMASHTYEFNAKGGNAKDTKDYPIQYFHYAPFNNYLVYENTGCLPSAENETQDQQLPLRLLPSLPYEGALYLELENIIAPGEVSLYFELAQTYKIQSIRGKAKVNYRYLSTDGWKKLPVLSDGTNDFSCSGIIRVNIPSDITTDHPTMPQNKYWILIGVHTDPNSFAKTVFLKSNGIQLKRSGHDNSYANEAPIIKSNIISAPHSPMPKIASLTQPFPSFGGRAPEDQNTMNKRVSNRLYTKDRATNREDFYKLIKQEYDNIYYSKTLFDQEGNQTKVLVIKKIESVDQTNAYTPFITACEAENILIFLRKRTSPFAHVAVSNFQLLSVQVRATILLKPGFVRKGMDKIINQRINVFLSPWIKSSEQQISIDSGITSAQVAGFISQIDGVLDIKKLCIVKAHKGMHKKSKANKNIESIHIPNDALLVPVPVHGLTYRTIS